jgi:RNA recognition motif-containing protein
MRQVLMNIYVGNLPYRLTNEKLEETFASFGQVSKANIIMDRETGRSKGFGFVEMPSAAEAEAAINALNGTELEGRNITVNQARPREDNRPKQRKAW